MAVIISDKYKYIFIHIPKTGGRSVSQALLTHGEGRFLEKFKNDADTGEGVPSSFVKHAYAKSVRNMLGTDIYDSMETFAFVRNPYERLWSLYRYQRQRKWQERARGMRAIYGLKFNDFVCAACENSPRPMSDYITDKSGNLIIKSVLKFERLEKDFASWSSDVIGEAIILPVIGGTRGSVEDEPFAQRSVSRVQHAYAKDFELFGYELTPPREGGVYEVDMTRKARRDDDRSSDATRRLGREAMRLAEAEGAAWKDLDREQRIEFRKRLNR